VVIHGDGAAPALDRRATGLFHLAILLPSRADLALALARVVAARWPLDGASDHLVSEALYLSDPDGNGIELYRDRPREEWRRNGDELAMATLPLDLDDVISAAGGLASEPPREVPAGTTIGHVHLQVGDLGVSESFYRGVLGFDVTVRSYPGALFLSAGGYHHHIGLNTWRSAGGRRPVDGAVGLRHFAIVLSDQSELERVLDRVRGAGLGVSPCHGGALVRDPSGIGVLLRAT
jgi:catechol 2,3-dioxygenase